MKLEQIEYDWSNHEQNIRLETLIARANVITVNEFESKSDLEYLLDEEETFEEYISMDDESIFFEINLDNESVTGMKSLGVIHLFSKNGQLPDLNNVKPEMATQELSMNALAWVMSPINSPNSISKTNNEELEYDTGKIRKFSSNDGMNARYQAIVKGKVVAAIFIKESVTDAIYTSIEFRRKGLGKKLVQIAKNDFQHLQHSDSRTSLGTKFINGIELDNNEMTY